VTEDQILYHAITPNHPSLSWLTYSIILILISRPISSLRSRQGIGSVLWFPAGTTWIRSPFDKAALSPSKTSERTDDRQPWCGLSRGRFCRRTMPDQNLWNFQKVCRSWFLGHCLTPSSGSERFHEMAVLWMQQPDVQLHIVLREMMAQ